MHASNTEVVDSALAANQLVALRFLHRQLIYFGAAFFMRGAASVAADCWQFREQFISQRVPSTSSHIVAIRCSLSRVMPSISSAAPERKSSEPF
jgi:hypothetical protein